MSRCTDIMDDKSISDIADSPPHLEPTDDDPSSEITPVGVEKQDIKQSSALHHNSRRRRRGSAVVLNAKKMQKILEGQSENDSTSYFEYEVASTVSRTEMPQMKLNFAFSIFQKKWRAYRNSRIQLSLEKIPSGGVVNQSAADRIFALIQGWRIRFLFRSQRIKRSINALNDVYKVLMEVMVAIPASPSSSSGAAVSREPLLTTEESKYAANRFYMFKSICLFSKNRSMENAKSGSSGSEIPYADRVLVDHLIKEALLMRAMIHRTLFEDVVWSSFRARAISGRFDDGPLAAGFWDFSAPVKIVLSASNAINNQAAANSTSSSDYYSPNRKGSSPIRTSPIINRSASGTEGEQKQRQQKYFEASDKPDKPNSAKQNAPTLPINVDETDRRGAIPIERTDVPLFELSSSTGCVSPKNETSLNETGDSVIQLDLASLRALTQRKRSVMQVDTGAATEEEAILGSRSKVRGIVKKAPGPASKAVPSSTSDKSGQSEPLRPENIKACIQLDILHADRLMPAKKGSVARDACGNAVPDRKPCLQISLLMPTAGPSPLKSKRPRPGTGNNVSMMDSDDDDDDAYGRSEELKRIHHISREYSEVTLNPRWKESDKKDTGSTFYLPLPCPKRIILSDRSTNDVMVSESISDFSFSMDTESSSSSMYGRSAEDKDKEISYQKACKGLLAHWSQGLIKIQIIDGERFNEDIFLGEITLRLASFFVPQAYSSKKASNGVVAEARNAISKSQSHPQHEVSGTYPLCKAKASDRVSGSVTLHAYLHLPDISYVEAVRSTVPQHSLLQQPSLNVLPQRRHTAAARVAWSDPNVSTDRRVGMQKDVIPPPMGCEDLESSPIANEWDDDDDDPLQLSFAPHSPKVAESPDRRLFRHRPAVCSFGVHGHHGPDSKSKIRMYPSTPDGSGLQVHSDLMAGSTKLGLDFRDDCDNDVNSDGEAEDRDEWDPSGLALIRQTSSNRSASKLAAKRGVTSSSAVSTNRQSMLDGVSKCLDGLSMAQDGADSYLERMQKKLEVMQSAKVAKEGEKSPPQRSKSDSSISSGNMKTAEVARSDIDQQGALTPTRKKKKSEKDIEKENKVGTEKFEVYKAVKVAAKSNFLSLSPAPLPAVEPSSLSLAVGPSPFRDVTDTSNTVESCDVDDGPQSPDNSEMIVVTSEGYTITKSSSGVAHMTSNPSSPSKTTTPNKKRPSKIAHPPSISLFDSTSSPTLLSAPEDAARVDDVVISEGWRKRNVERGKLSAASSPVRNG